MSYPFISERYLGHKDKGFRFSPVGAAPYRLLVMRKFAGLLNFWLFLMFSLGVIAGRFLFSFALFFTLALISFLLVHIFYKKHKLFLSDFFILFLFICLGAMWVRPYFIYKQDLFLGENAFILKVSSLPQSFALKNTFLAKVTPALRWGISFEARVMDYTKQMQYQHTYKLKARLSKRRYWDRDFYYLWVKSGTVRQELPQNLADKFAAGVTGDIREVWESNVSEEAGRFLSSVFLGRREMMLPAERETFSAAGVSHLLAISGLHIGLTALVLFFILKFFGLNFKTCLVVSLGFLYLYTFITGAVASTLRATIMYSVFAVSFFVRRKVHLLNSLGLAGIIVLLLDPQLLFAVGFQLSFLSVFAIILGFRIFTVPLPRNTVLRYIKQVFFCSLYVTVFITPPVAYYFGKVYLLSIFYNIFLIPFFTLILALNFLLLIFSPFPFMAQSIGIVLSGLIAMFMESARILAAVKYSFIPCSFSLKAVGAYYFSAAVFAAGIKRYLDKRRPPAPGVI